MFHKVVTNHEVECKLQRQWFNANEVLLKVIKAEGTWKHVYNKDTLESHFSVRGLVGVVLWKFLALFSPDSKVNRIYSSWQSWQTYSEMNLHWCGVSLYCMSGGFLLLQNICFCGCICPLKCNLHNTHTGHIIHLKNTNWWSITSNIWIKNVLCLTHIHRQYKYFER